MTFNDDKKFGIYVLLINIIISLFLLSSEGEKAPLIITTLASNVVALVFNGILLSKSKRKLLNVITLVLNVVVMLVIVLLIYKRVI